jgi:hypothetical protein
MMRVPTFDQRLATSLALSISGDIQMPTLTTTEKASHSLLRRRMNER